MLERLRDVRREDGVIATEYIIILVLIAIAIIAGAIFLGTTINDELSEAASQVQTSV